MYWTICSTFTSIYSMNFPLFSRFSKLLLYFSDFIPFFFSEFSTFFSNLVTQPAHRASQPAASQPGSQPAQPDPSSLTSANADAQSQVRWPQDLAARPRFSWSSSQKYDVRFLASKVRSPHDVDIASRDVTIT